jgi:hypothetical protein
MNCSFARLTWSAVVVACVSAAPSALAQTAPSLGTAESFAVLGASTVTNTGPSVVTGDLGVHPGSAVIGFPPGIVIGTIHAADAQALSAQNSLVTAYTTLAGAPFDVDLTGQDLGGLSLTQGVYRFDSSAQLTGSLTLTGNSASVFIFQIGSTLTTASNSSVSLIGVSPCNVFWQLGSSGTLGTNTSFVGNLLALTSITLNTGAGLQGRALADNGAVTLDTNNVDASACLTAVPTMPQSMVMVLALGLTGLGWLALRRRASNGI